MVRKYTNDMYMKEVKHNLLHYIYPNTPGRILKGKNTTYTDSDTSSILSGYIKEYYYPQCHNSILNPLFHAFYRAGIVIDDSYSIPITLGDGSAKVTNCMDIIQGYIPKKIKDGTKRNRGTIYKSGIILGFTESQLKSLTYKKAYTDGVMSLLKIDMLAGHIMWNKKKYLAFLKENNILHTVLQEKPYVK